MIFELFGMRLATYISIGKELGVKPNQVYMWHQRRERNGFPAPVMHRRAGNGVNDAPWFDLDEVRAWHDSYAPSRGGYHTHTARRTS